MKFQEQIDKALIALNEAEQAEMKARGYIIEPDKWHAVEKKKYINIDCGTSGAFMVDKTTGEIFNIQGYGRPDKNKKKKADIGNIQTVDPTILHSKRWNYLR